MKTRDKKGRRSFRVLPAVVVLMAALAMRCLPLAAAEGEVNNGQDITRPLTRLDIRYEYQNAPGHKNDNVNIMTLRVDKPFKLSPTWEIATRFDVPFMVTDRRSRDNIGGSDRFGVSDLLAQAFIVHTPSERFAWGLGAQIVFPTGLEDQMGTGTYRVVPTVGARWTTNNILQGSWFALAMRWDKSFAFARENTRHVNELQFAPLINIPLPRQFFLNLFPSTDIKVNLGKKRSGDAGRWFVPANLLVGKMLRKNIVTSVEVGIPSSTTTRSMISRQNSAWADSFNHRPEGKEGV